MFSGTRCPALSDELKKWSESRAAALKGVLEGLEGKFQAKRADLKLGELIGGLQVSFEV